MVSLPARLEAALGAPGSLTVALSGGVDSLTLSAAAARVRGAQGLELCHAVSPAVPAAATARVRDFARRHGLALKVVDAGEFADPRYRANPVNRCYFCKSNLYGTLARMGTQVAAGTNTDDLADYRPGLHAAREHGVLHPFVSAGMSKADVRALARQLGLGALAELPAAPCLASRVQTGLRVEPGDLRRIDRVESRLRDALGGVTLRFRRERAGWVIELEAQVLEGLDETARAALLALAEGEAGARDEHGEAGEAGEAGAGVTLRPYRRGSAFVHGQA